MYAPFITLWYIGFIGIPVCAIASILSLLARKQRQTTSVFASLALAQVIGVGLATNAGGAGDWAAFLISPLIMMGYLLPLVGIGIVLLRKATTKSA